MASARRARAEQVRAVLAAGQGCFALPIARGSARITRPTQLDGVRRWTREPREQRGRVWPGILRRTPNPDPSEGQPNPTSRMFLAGGKRPPAMLAWGPGIPFGRRPRSFPCPGNSTRIDRRDRADNPRRDSARRPAIETLYRQPPGSRRGCRPVEGAGVLLGRLDVGRARLRVPRLVECGRAGHVRAGHRRAGERRVTRPPLRRQHAHAGCDQVDVRADVREVRECVGEADRTGGCPRPPGLPSKSAIAETVITSS